MNAVIQSGSVVPDDGSTSRSFLGVPGVRALARPGYHADVIRLHPRG